VHRFVGATNFQNQFGRIVTLTRPGLQLTGSQWGRCHAAVAAASTTAIISEFSNWNRTMKFSTLMLSSAAIASSASFAQNGPVTQSSPDGSSGLSMIVEEAPAPERPGMMSEKSAGVTTGTAAPDDLAASLNADLERMKRGDGTGFRTIVHIAATMKDAKRAGLLALAHHMTVKVMKVGNLFGWAAVPSFVTPEQVSEQIARELCARQNIPFEGGKIVVIAPWFQNNSDAQQH